MARFLSAEWLADLDGELRADPDGGAATAGLALTVEQVVTGAGTGAGEVRYALVVADGRVDVRPGPAERPDVTLTGDWDTAVAIGRGELGAQEAFMTGRLTVAGDMAALLRAGPALARLHAAAATVHTRTTY